MDYSELVAALKKPSADILATLDEIKIDANHMAIGIAGEALELLENLDELSMENIVEETGDLMFYAVGLSQTLGLEMDWFDNDAYDNVYDIEALSEYVIDTAKAAGKVLDLVKKWTVYNKPFGADELDSLLAALNHLIDCMHGVVSCCGMSMKFIERYNKAKLTERYGEKYSDAAAVARADKAGAE